MVICKELQITRPLLLTPTLSFWVRKQRTLLLFNKVHGATLSEISPLNNTKTRSIGCTQNTQKNSLLAKSIVFNICIISSLKWKKKLAKSKINIHRLRDASLIAHSVLFTEQKSETTDASFSLKFLSVWKSHLNCWISSIKKSDVKNDEMNTRIYIHTVSLWKNMNYNDCTRRAHFQMRFAINVVGDFYLQALQ